MPDDDPVITFMPRPRATETTAAANQSLNDPVGFRLSSLRYRFRRPRPVSEAGRRDQRGEAFAERGDRLRPPATDPDSATSKPVHRCGGRCRGPPCRARHRHRTRTGSWACPVRHEVGHPPNIAPTPNLASQRGHRRPSACIEHHTHRIGTSAVVCRRSCLWGCAKCYDVAFGDTTTNSRRKIGGYNKSAVSRPDDGGEDGARRKSAANPATFAVNRANIPGIGREIVRISINQDQVCLESGPQYANPVVNPHQLRGRFIPARKVSGAPRALLVHQFQLNPVSAAGASAAESLPIAIRTPASTARRNESAAGAGSRKPSQRRPVAPFAPASIWSMMNCPTPGVGTSQVPRSSINSIASS